MKTNPTTWLAGGAALLSVENADAALVSIQLGSSYQLVDADTASPFAAEAGLATQSNLQFDQALAGSSGTIILGNSITDNLVAYDILFSTFNAGNAGSAVGAANEELRGLAAVTLSLAAGGQVEGWLVVENTADFGVFSLTDFIFDDESLEDRDANEVATLAGFDNGDFATVDTVAAIPEPSSLALLALGAGGVMLRRNRKDVA